MESPYCVYFALFLLFILNVNGKIGELKLCVVGNPKIKSTRTTKYCDLLSKSKRTPASCYYATDRLECLMAVSKRKADFSVFEPEDLYFSTLWDESSVLVVSEIRALKKKAFQSGIVAMVRKSSNITGIGDLRGKRLCHPGMESGPDWNYMIAQYFEERLAPADCDRNLSVYEDRIKTTSEFFGSGCKAGPWSLDPNEDSRLKKKYWNLCALCDSGGCGSSDKYRGSGGSLICFKDGVGDVLWTRYEDVKAHFKFLDSDSSSANEFYFLCDDGSLLPLSTSEPCLWLAKPWRVLAANRKSATDVQKIVDILSDDEHNDWEQNLLHIIELYLEYIENMQVSRTPEDYLRRIPGYLSASTMSQGNCNPTHSINFCVVSGIEKQKCEWMSKAGSSLGIQPSIQCLQKSNFSSCLQSVAEKESDVVSVSPDFLHEATIVYKLNTLLFESGAHLNDSYLTSIIVRKKSGIKTLSELKGKRVCLTREHGIGWWTLSNILKQEALISSSCEGLKDYFEDVCVTASEEESSLNKCCPKGSFDEEEADILQCLYKSGCDAAVVDLNVLKRLSDSEGMSGNPKGFRVSDLRTVCNEKWKDCHWTWSHPHYIMSHASHPSPKALEIYQVFYELGQYFGKNSRKNNPMLEIFGPFHDINNVLFSDSSTSFVPVTPWNNSNNFLNMLDQMKICSKSPPRVVPSIISLVFTLYVLNLSTN